MNGPWLCLSKKVATTTSNICMSGVSLLGCDFNCGGTRPCCIKLTDCHQHLSEGRLATCVRVKGKSPAHVCFKLILKWRAHPYCREKLQERLAKLSGGVAVLKIGGASEIEVGRFSSHPFLHSFPSLLASLPIPSCISSHLFPSKG